MCNLAYNATIALYTEYLTSYTNALQLIGYQYLTQCKMLPNPPTHNLHNLHAGKRIRDASIYTSKKYRSSFYS